MAKRSPRNILRDQVGTGPVADEKNVSAIHTRRINPVLGSLSGIFDPINNMQMIKKSGTDSIRSRVKVLPPKDHSMLLKVTVKPIIRARTYRADSLEVGML